MKLKKRSSVCQIVLLQTTYHLHFCYN